MFTVNCLNPGVMSSLRFPPFNRKHFVSLGEDKSLKGEGWGGGGGGGGGGVEYRMFCPITYGL